MDLVDPAPWQLDLGCATNLWPSDDGCATPELAGGVGQMEAPNLCMAPDSSLGLTTETCGLFDNGKQCFVALYVSWYGMLLTVTSLSSYAFAPYG